MEMNIKELHVDISNKLGVPEDAIEITPAIMDGKLTLSFGIYIEKVDDLSATSEVFQDLVNKAKEKMKYNPLDDFEDEDIDDDDAEDEKVNGGHDEDVNIDDDAALGLDTLYPNGLSLNNYGLFVTGGGNFSTEGVEEMLDALTAVCDDNPIAISLIEELTRTLTET